MDYDKKNIEYRKASVQKKLKEIKNVAAGEVKDDLIFGKILQIFFSCSVCAFGKGPPGEGISHET